MRNAHCRTWYVSCTEKHEKWEMHSVEYYTWICCSEKQGKWETHTVEHGIKVSFNEKH